MSSTPSRITLSTSLLQAILAHLTACLPEEGCGLLGGELDGQGQADIRAVIPVENSLHSPVRFRMDPAAQLQAFNRLDEQGLELLAIFHSHPNGPDSPSITDLTEFAYPGVLTLIFSPLDLNAQPDNPACWQCKSYRIDGVLSGQPTAVEVELRVLDEPSSPQPDGV